MNCFVHVGYDPVPKGATSPESAICMAENYLKRDDDEDDPSFWKIKWRRDELYPDNFTDYDIKALKLELAKSGCVVLQLILDQPDDMPIMGETASIFTEETERQNDQEAEEALELDIYGEEKTAIKRKFPAKKK
jgi:hypothetical protein